MKYGSFISKTFSKKHNEIPLHTHQCHSSERPVIASVDQDTEKLGHSYTGGRNVKLFRCPENILVVPQNVKHKVTV